MASRYHRILGVPEGASKEQIKKAYRAKVMRWHPDVNPAPNAQENFLLITEAYEGLLEGRTGPRPKRKRGATTKEPKEEEKRRHRNDPYKPAADPVERRRRREEQLLQEGVKHYKAYKKSGKHKVTGVITILSVLLGVVFALDFFLPMQKEKHVVEGKYFQQEAQAGSNNNQVSRYYLELADGEVREVNLPVYLNVRSGDAVIFKETPMFGQFLEMDRLDLGYKATYRIDNTLDQYFWVLLLFLLLPLLRYKLDKPHVSFYFFEFSIRTGIVVVNAFVVVQLLI